MHKTTAFTIIFAALITFSDFARASDPMSEILSSYLSIQESLAADSSDGLPSKAHAIVTLSARLKDSALATSIQASARTMEQADSIDTARNSFKKLSAVLVSWAKVARPSGIDIVYCSMAHAGWLQKKGAIRNPYYGKSMSVCGQKET